MKKLTTLIFFSMLFIDVCYSATCSWIDRGPYNFLHVYTYNNIIHSITVPCHGEQAEQRKMISVTYGEVYRGEQYRYSGNWYTKGSEGDLRLQDDNAVKVYRTEYIK